MVSSALALTLRCSLPNDSSKNCSASSVGQKSRSSSGLLRYVFCLHREAFWPWGLMIRRIGCEGWLSTKRTYHKHHPSFQHAWSCRHRTRTSSQISVSRSRPSNAFHSKQSCRGRFIYRSPPRLKVCRRCSDWAWERGVRKFCEFLASGSPYLCRGTEGQAWKFVATQGATSLQFAQGAGTHDISFAQSDCEF